MIAIIVLLLLLCSGLLIIAIIQHEEIKAQEELINYWRGLAKINQGRYGRLG